MVAISFSVFKDKILSGEKTQTIRRWNSKRAEQMINKGKLQLYWKQRSKESEFLREVELEEIERIAFSKPDGWRPESDEDFWNIDVLMVDNKIKGLYRLTDIGKHELALRDGFESFREMTRWFYEKYGDEMFAGDFMVIRWKNSI